MASRENTGLQVALIIFVLIVIGEAIPLFYMVFVSLPKAHDDTVAANKQYDDEKLAREGAQAQNDLLKAYVGESRLADDYIKEARTSLQSSHPDRWREIEIIDAKFEQDMAKFDTNYFDEAYIQQNMPEKENIPGVEKNKYTYKNWRTLPPLLEFVIRKKNTEIQNAIARANAAEQKRDTDVKAEQARVVAAEKEFADEVNNFNDEKKTFATQNARLADQNKDIASQMNTNTKKFTGEAQVKDGEIKKLQGAQQTLANTISSLKKENSTLKGHSFDVADGRITLINQRSRSVRINLGFLDGLQRQTTFSVYDKNETHLGSGGRGEQANGDHDGAVPKKKESIAKASIEVVQIIDNHSAECRILDDDPSNPILPGDVIYTPAWAPGRKVHFAIAGKIDINDDERSDARLVMNLIQLNGGEVDAVAVDDPAIEPFGRMNVHTRYLVVGESPTDESDPEIRNRWRETIKDLEDFGVERVSVQKFLTWMGYRGEVRTVHLGKGGGTRDSSKTFRPRRPPAAGKRGAY